MGLPFHTFTEYQNQRLYSMILFEDVPRMSLFLSTLPSLLHNIM